jgi:hypothetical protein
MSAWIAEGVLYLTRADWGADPTLPRLGGPEDPRRPGGYPLVPRSQRLYDLTHHTVIVDSDVTRNVWETLEEVRLQMRRLQVIRPDLGLDVPYNFVLFLMEGGTICVCEGRGYDRWGAHTADKDAAGRWWNGAGIATAWQGNFENFPLPLDAHGLAVVNRWNAHKRAAFGPQYGTPGACGRPFCGHRDTAQTACPGRWLYEALPRFSFETDLEVELMGGAFALVDPENGTGFWLTNGFVRRHSDSPEERKAWARIFGIPETPQKIDAALLMELPEAKTS